MPFSNDGLFIRAIDFTSFAKDRRPVAATALDEEFDNFARGLSSAFARDGSIGLTGDLPMGDHRLIDVGLGTIDQPSIVSGNNGIVFSSTGVGAIVNGVAMIDTAILGTSFGGMVRATGHGGAAGGDRAIEITLDAGRGLIRAYDRQQSANMPLLFDATHITHAIDEDDRLTVTAADVLVKRAGNDLFAIAADGALHMAVGQAIGAGAGWLGHQGDGMGRLTLWTGNRTELASSGMIEMSAEGVRAVEISAGHTDVVSGLRVAGTGMWPAAGGGVEIEYTAGSGYVSAIDRNENSMMALVLRGDTIGLHAGGSEIAKLSNLGLAIVGDIVVNNASLLDRIALLEAKIAALETK